MCTGLPLLGSRAAPAAAALKWDVIRLSKYWTAFCASSDDASAARCSCILESTAPSASTSLAFSEVRVGSMTNMIWGREVPRNDTGCSRRAQFMISRLVVRAGTTLTCRDLFEFTSLSM